MYRNAPEAGLASLLASRGRDGDSTLVHMAPQEVRGLQALALAHGGSLSINPRTGLYEASFLKKILPTIVGATLKTVAPGLGQAVGKMLPFGLSDEAASNVGTGLLVGGATGLIEGDLKKGLMAGLGAYSGATLASGLEQAALATRPQAASPSTVSNIAPPVIRPSGMGQIDVASGGAAAVPSLSSMMGGAAPPMPSPVSYTPPTQAADVVKTVTKRPGLMEGVNAMFTPEGRKAFGQATGGGFQSPMGQMLSQYATSYGALLPFAQEPQQFPGAGGGAAGEDIVYIPGGFNPQYGSGKDQPYQLPGQYYKRTAKGLVPYNPWQKAPGFAMGGVIPRPNGNYPLAKPTQAVGGYEMSVDPYTGEEKFADGGAVQGPINVPAYAAPTTDPNVMATRSYIEELNRRVRAGGGGMDQAAGGGGLGSFGGAGMPIQTGGGGGGGVGGGAAGPGVGDIVGGIAANYLVNKGIETGIGYLKDKFFPGEDQLKEVEVTGTRTPTTDGGVGGAGGMPQVGGDLSNLSSYMPTTAGLNSLGTLGGLNSTGFQMGQFGPSIDVAGGANVPDLSSMMKPSGSIASQYGGMRGALDAGTKAGDAAASGLKGLHSVTVEPLSYQGAPMTILDEGARNIAGSVINRAMNTPLSGALTPADIADLSSSYTQLDPSLYKAPSTVTADLGGKGLGSLQGKIIPGVQTALGAVQAYEGIRKGNEAQAALGAYGASSGLGSLLGFAGAGPIGLAAAGIAALGASLVNTKEMGDVALRNYWKAVDQGRGFGQAPPKELAEGFINFYRTNKNEFPGQGKYGRKGNEDFLYDMTQVINKAVKDGKVDKNVDAPTMYKEVVQPWIDSFGYKQNINADTKKVQDFMMTDLIYNFMQGNPISNAQVKGDKKYKIVSEKPVYAGAAPMAEAPAQSTAYKYSKGVPPAYTKPFDLAAFRAQGGEGRETAMPTGEEERLGPGSMPLNPYMYAPETAGMQFNQGGAIGDEYNFGFARGGMSALPEYKAGGRLLNGPGDGMSDDIPAVIRGKGVQRAALADGEFVIPADVVSHLGNGSTNAGAKKLYAMMSRVRKARTGKTRQAPAVKMDRHLPA